jgi:hypothetical protein
MDPDAQIAFIVFGAMTMITVFSVGITNMRKMVEARHKVAPQNNDELNALRYEVQELRGAVHDLMLQVEMGEKPVQVADRLTPPEFNKH